MSHIARVLPFKSSEAVTIGEFDSYASAKQACKEHCNNQTGDNGMLLWVCNRYGVVMPNGDIIVLGE